MSAVAVRPDEDLGSLHQHPWVTAVRTEVSSPSGGSRRIVARVVPSDAGLAVLRARGKAALVGELAAAAPGLPADPASWRLVEDLALAALDDDDRRNRPRVRTLEVRGGSELQARLLVPFDLALFAGHFPTIPLLPGMSQVAWAVDIARAHLPGVGPLAGILAAKFRRLVRPGMQLQLDVQWSAAAGELQFEYRHGAEAASTGRLRVQAIDV